MATGVDVSSAQGKIDWRKVVAVGGIDFVYAKATDGVDGTDPMFANNWAGLNAVHIQRGAYHFYEPVSDPVRQAERFFAVVGKLEIGDLPPMLDLEARKPAGKTNADFLKEVRVFVERAESLFECELVIYTGGPYFDSACVGVSEEDVEFFSTRDLWLAAYVFNPKIFIPKAWSKLGKSWVIWQKSGNIGAGNSPGFRLPGIGVVTDLNVTQGAANDLPTWAVSKRRLKPTPEPVLVVTPPVSPVSEPTVIIAEPVKKEDSTVVVVDQPVKKTGILQYIIIFIKWLIALVSTGKG